MTMDLPEELPPTSVELDRTTGLTIVWADGTAAREDGLKWTRDDLGPDGTHPSEAGREKVAEQLLGFFSEDSLAKSWFHGKIIVSGAM